MHAPAAIAEIYPALIATDRHRRRRKPDTGFLDFRLQHHFSGQEILGFPHAVDPQHAIAADSREEQPGIVIGQGETGRKDAWQVQQRSFTVGKFQPR